MPIFDDRFARQNRCEPPPEFPLASPYTGIVHLLSGPAPYALTQIHPRTSGSVDDAPKLSPAFTFITRRGLTPEHSHTKTTPWSVFQDGSLMTITPASLPKRGPRSPQGHDAAGYNTPEGATFPRPLSPQENRCWPAPCGVHRRRRRVVRGAQVWSQALPFQQFHVLFNPLFKVLFIFRSLYLCAIGLWPVFSFRRNLPPILSSIPKLLDSSKELCRGWASVRTGLSPSVASCSKELGRRRAKSILSKLQLGPGGQISNLSCCRFTRRYWGNPCWFLFLRLLICLSSAGIPT